MAKIEHELALHDEATKVYNQFVGNINKQAATIENTMKGIGTAIGAAFSIAGISAFMKNAAEANTQVTLLERALANNGLNQYKQELIEASKALRDKTAVDDDEIVKLQTLLLNYTGNINAVKQLTPAILDLAAGTGMSVEQAAKLVARSNEGSEGLKKLGIVIGETSNEQERLARITEEVTKRYGGMAEAFAQTDAGGLQKLSNAMDDLEESAGNVFLNILKPALPGILKLFDMLSWAVDKIFGSLKVGITVLMTGVLIPLARIEEALNNIGVTNSRVLQNFLASGMRQTAEAANELVGGAEAANKTMQGMGASAQDSASKQRLLSDEIKKLKDEINKLEIGSEARIQKLVQLNRLEAEQKELLAQETLEVLRITRGWDSFKTTMNAAGLMATKTGKDYKKSMDEIKLSTVQVKETTTIMFSDIMREFEQAQQVTTELTNMVFSNFQQALQSTFAGEAGVIKQFFKAALNAVITFVEGYLAAAAAQALAKGVFTFGATVGADIAIIAAATAALEVARAAINRFHDGGVVGQSGERIPLQSDERLAILRVGETVLPTRPGEHAAQATTIFAPTININAPGTPKEMVIGALRQFVRETGMTLDKLIIDNSKGISIAY